jgi:hypothetical protein
MLVCFNGKGARVVDLNGKIPPKAEYISSSRTYQSLSRQIAAI